MGADLYALSERYKRYCELLDLKYSKRSQDVSQEELEKLDKEIDKIWNEMYMNYEYFRDSYNSSNLLWLLGLNYWIWFAQFMEKNSCIISAENCKKILKIVLRRGHMITKERIREKLEEDLGSGVDIEEWYKYFKDKYNRFIKFLERCIECGGMEASV